MDDSSSTVPVSFYLAIATDLIAVCALAFCIALKLKARKERKEASVHSNETMAMMVDDVTFSPYIRPPPPPPHNVSAHYFSDWRSTLERQQYGTPRR